MRQISENVFCHTDTCNVYVIRSGTDAVLIDFGDGSVREELEAIGVTRITDVLMTHHHRDQAQGIRYARETGARVFVPHMEQELFRDVDWLWQGRGIYNNYNVRQDRFSLLEPVAIEGTLRDYETVRFGQHNFHILPTPGHTIGSITLVTEIDETRYAFTGDLIYAPGKVWSLSATQWSYNGAQGIASGILSLLDLKQRSLSVLLPSHGDRMDAPEEAIDLLVRRLWDLLYSRNPNGTDLLDKQQKPFVQVTPHLLWNRTCFANSYVVLSQSGKALLIDYGYDFAMLAAGEDRAARRPWLYNIPALKREFGVTEVDVVIATHYHDDHVAGFNLLQSIEGTEVWAAENFADILENPEYNNIPCTWYDPIRVDKRLPLDEPVRWEEYEFTMHAQPGHTLYAVAIEFAVDGHQVVAIGDQQENAGYLWNYVYQNRFRFEDYRKSAQLYKAIAPDLIISGHWDPLWVEPDYFDTLLERGERLLQLHRDLLPLEDLNLEAEGFAAWIRPYQVKVAGGSSFRVEVEVLNPLPSQQTLRLQMVVPEDWPDGEREKRITLDANARGYVSFDLVATQVPARRIRIAVDVTVGQYRLGQQAEALVTVERE